MHPSGLPTTLAPRQLEPASMPRQPRRRYPPTGEGAVDDPDVGGAVDPARTVERRARRVRQDGGPRPGTQVGCRQGPPGVAAGAKIASREYAYVQLRRMTTPFAYSSLPGVEVEPQGPKSRLSG